ncbi:hypothetical protein QQ045_003928 [Rhodiola kirilowii]
MNRIYHNKDGVDLRLAVSKVKSTVSENSKPESGDRWCPPEAGSYKISCDGAWNSLSKEAGIGVECRDSEGSVEFVEAVPLSNQENLIEVEGLALRRGMELAAERNLSKVVFVSDNVEVIQSLIPFSVPVKGGSWLQACFELMETNTQWRLEHAVRGGNRVADFLTQKAREGRWVWEHPCAIPICLSSVVRQDDREQSNPFKIAFALFLIASFIESSITQSSSASKTAASSPHRRRWEPATEIGRARFRRIPSSPLALHLASLQARFVFLFRFSYIVVYIVIIGLKGEAEGEIGEGRSASVAVAAFDSVL